VQRAALQRGESSFRKPLIEVAHDYAVREPRLLGAFEVGGWRVCRVDASGPEDHVLRDALELVQR
jgi:hypothetical protein